MVTLRHLIAVGALTGITLSNMGMGYAVDLPSPTQSQNTPSNSDQTQTPTEPPASVAQTKSPPLVNPQPSGNNPNNPPPEYLNPHPNPLLFPTNPDEVRLRQQEPITLQQALELARKNSQELQVYVLTVERSRAALQEALAEQFPTLDLSADLTNTDSASGQISNQRLANTGSSSEDDDLLSQITSNSTRDTVSSSFSTSLQLNYDIYTSGRRSAAIRAAEQQVRFDELELELRSEQLRLDVSNAYYDLQQADEQVRIAEAAVVNSSRSLSDAEALERAGLGTRFDVLRSRVQLANSNQDLVQARSQQRISRRQLAQLLNLSQIADISAADPIQEAGVWNLALEDSIILALKNRAELEQQLARRNISDEQRRVALAATKPQVSLFASYNVQDVFQDDAGPGDGYSLGARLRWSLFDGGAARARATQQAANMAIAETQFASNRNQVRFEVEQAYSNLRANAENIQTATIAVEQADESLRLANLRFRAGVGTQTDVINAETELTRARVNRLQAVIGYNRSLAALQRAVSNLPDSNLTNRQ